MDIIFHYPPELLSLLKEAVPKLCRSKQDLLLFFQGAGVGAQLLAPYQALLQADRKAFNKFHVTRELLARLNELGEASLRERREIIKRVTDFQDFSVCWESDQSAARGLVAQIRELVNVKDSFTRMNLEREAERKARLESARQHTADISRRRQEAEEIRRQFFGLFTEVNPQKRGKALEAVLNRYFRFSGILISEAIALKGDAGSGIVEQIDGVIQLRGQLYLVEMKWEQETLGREKVSSHLVRVFNRSLAGGIIISYSGYSDAAVADCRDALRQKVIVLCKLEEMVRALEREEDLSAIFDAKIDAAIIHKNPLFLPTL